MTDEITTVTTQPRGWDMPADAIDFRGMTEPSPDNINHPAHYNSLGAVCKKCQHPIECVDIAENLGFNIGNAIKYLWRAGKKGAAAEDFKKAKWYIQRQIDRLEKKEK